MKFRKGQVEIRNVEDWLQFAPPKRRAVQWKDGRSAKELAKAWCGRRDYPSPPEEFLQLLSPLVTAKQLGKADGWPEHIVRIDDLPGEQPNIDLALTCNGRQGRTAICVEAKADESFGQYVSEKRRAATNKIAQGIPTKANERIERLEKSLFSDDLSSPFDEADLRYQLLTGTAATLAFANLHQAPVAVFVVHEFLLAPHFDEKKVAENDADLSRFVTQFTNGAVTAVADGALQGPVISPLQQRTWGGVSLYLGKVRTTRTAAGASR